MLPFSFQPNKAVSGCSVSPNFQALREFCHIILEGNHPSVVEHCCALIQENPNAIDAVLSYLSGLSGTQGSSPFRAQYYMFTIDLNHANLAELLTSLAHCPHNLSLDCAQFSTELGVVSWLRELSQQFPQGDVLVFDCGSSLCHFCLMNKETGIITQLLFEKMSEHVTTYPHKAHLVDSHFVVSTP